MYTSGSSTNVMCPLASKIRSSAFGARAAMASAASTVHVRSCRPVMTNSGDETSPSRSSTSMPPYPFAENSRSTSGEYTVSFVRSR